MCAEGKTIWVLLEECLLNILDKSEGFSILEKGLSYYLWNRTVSSWKNPQKQNCILGSNVFIWINKCWLKLPLKPTPNQMELLPCYCKHIFIQLCHISDCILIGLWCDNPWPTNLMAWNWIMARNWIALYIYKHYPYDFSVATLLKQDLFGRLETDSAAFHGNAVHRSD